MIPLNLKVKYLQLQCHPFLAVILSYTAVIDTSCYTLSCITVPTQCFQHNRRIVISGTLFETSLVNVVHVVVVYPTPPTCCQQSPAPESCGSQQSLPPGGKERLHFVGIRPEVQARKGGWKGFALK